MEISRRYRVNVTTGTKGVKTFDCTTEITVNEAEEPKLPEQIRAIILQESDALVAELLKRYPPPKE